MVATRERLHHLIDTLPEDAVAALWRVVEALRAAGSEGAAPIGPTLRHGIEAIPDTDQDRTRDMMNGHDRGYRELQSNPKQLGLARADEALFDRTVSDGLEDEPAYAQ